MKVQFLIDDQDFTEYVGFGGLSGEDWSTELARNNDLRIFLFQDDSDFSFTGPAAVYIYEQWQSRLTTDKLNLTVIVDPEATGYPPIINSKATFNLFSCTFNMKAGVPISVETEVEDSGYGKFIGDGREAPINIGSGKSRLGQDYNSAVGFNIEMFNRNGTPGSLVFGFDLLDALRDAVAFMSNGQLTLNSAWYDALPANERWFITSGINIRVPGTRANIQTNYRDLITNPANLYNLFTEFASSVPNSGTSDIINFERTNSLFDDTTSIKLDLSTKFGAPADYTLSVEESLLYQKIEIGSTENRRDETGNESNLPYIFANTQCYERYNIASEGNGGGTLDLSTTYITDNNLIFEILLDGNDDHDEDIVLIQYRTDDTPIKATGTNLITGIPGSGSVTHYNPAITNFEVLERWNVQGAVRQSYQVDDETFYATKLIAQCVDATGIPDFSNPEIIEPISFEDDFTLPDNSDPSNRWDVILSRYTAQQFGFYGFNACLIFDVSLVILPAPDPSGFIPNGSVEVSYVVYDSGGTQIAESFPDQDTGSTSVPQRFETDRAGVYKNNFFSTLYLRPDDYVEIRTKFRYLEACINPGSVFQCFSTPLGGGVFSEGDPSRYLCRSIEFSHPSTWATFENLKDNPTGAVEAFVNGQRVFKGWPERIRRKNKTGETEWKLLTSLSQQTLS